MKKIENIAVLTSGGDAPGLNAAIRSVVNTAMFYGLRVHGVHDGFEGLVRGDFIPLKRENVYHIIQAGGTILRSSRSKIFTKSAGRQMAYAQLLKHEIDALIVIGGDGTMRAISTFSGEFPVKCIGIPKTIDNDLTGTDYAIGFDTAVNTAMRAIDNIRDTADAHHRVFLVEVMGRDAGYIALHAGLGAGAEAILLPETTRDFGHLYRQLEIYRQQQHQHHSRSMVVVVAEGDEVGGVYQTAEKLKTDFHELEFHCCVLGHIQRGGSPTCADRVLAGKLGLTAVEALLQNKSGVMVGEIKGEIVETSLQKVFKRKAVLGVEMMGKINVLSA